MSWYKKAQQVVPISIVSYFPNIGELGISFNGGKTYVYPDVSPFLYERIDTLLRVKNYREVSKILKNISKKEEKTPEDSDEMVDELYDRGDLK